MRVLLILFVAFAGNFAYLALKEPQASASGSHSVELGFSSLSPSGSTGGEIIPASCESSWSHHVDDCLVMPDDACITGTTLVSGDGTDVTSGNNYGVTKFGGAYCFGNSGGPQYFAPTRTWPEFDSFYK